LEVLPERKTISQKAIPGSAATRQNERASLPPALQDNREKLLS